MACFHPLKGWRSRTLNATGKRSIVFQRSQGYTDLPVEVPCGQCSGCRLERSRQWAMRCLHEASLYEDNCFITLTYDDENIPAFGTLVKKDYQLFMKRLRKKFGSNIRFFQCGEYGENLDRPHYHACLFNFDFEDKVLFKTQNGHKLYTSEILSELWPNGYHLIGSVTFDSAAYVARYIMKKIKISDKTPDDLKDHYERPNVFTGELYDLVPEYTTMSRRPGIASEWYSKFKNDVYPSDFIVVNGKKMSPPKFYDKLFEAENETELKQLKARRKKQLEQHADNNTFRRLQDREQVQAARSKKLTRTYESE